MISELIQKARQRFLIHESLAQLALAASVAAGGIALLLIIGTTYVQWWTVALVSLGALGFGVWRVSKRIPGEYALAVQIDQTAGLHDAISTAVYYTTHDPKSPEFQAGQLSQAEAAAATVDLEVVMPFLMPRAIYALAACGLLATGLFIARYRISGNLDLRAPITQMLFEDQQNPELAKGAKKTPNGKKALPQNGMQSLLAKLGVNLNEEDQKTQDAIDKAIEEALKAPGAPGEGQGKGQAQSNSKDGKEKGAGEQAAKGDPMDGGKQDEAGKESDENGKQGSKEAGAGEDGKGKNASQNENGSLLSKLKEAAQNLMSKAKQDANKGGDNSKQESGQQQAKAEKASGEKGKSGKGQQGAQQSSQQEADPNGDSQEGQPSQGKAGAEDQNQKASSQPGSGVGHQDGAKDIKAAEQLKAMGKLSEIIGKRAQNVSGETSVEVQSGSQQLKTGYTQTNASHAQTDGDVSRDEVPAPMQRYIQQYFEQVRKGTEVPAAKKNP